MDETQIDTLERYLAAGSAAGWMDGQKMLRITSVVPSIDDEPSRCGILAGGGYVALWNADPNDIVIYSQMFVQPIVHRVQISKEAWVALFDAACDLSCTPEIEATGTPALIRERLDALLDACEMVLRETGRPTEADGAKKRIR